MNINKGIFDTLNVFKSYVADVFAVITVASG